MNQEDQEIINSFKQVVEYFAKKSTFEIVSQYKNLFENALEGVPQKHEFSSLLEAYRNSSPKAIKITFDQDIKRISSKKQYIKQIIYLFGEIMNSAPVILRNFSMLETEHIALMERIIKCSELINLGNVESEVNSSIAYSYEDLMGKLESIMSCFNRLKSELPFTKSNKIICNLFLLYLF